MMLPTIHLNGTSQESLHAGYREALQSIQSAIDALARIPPHGRDYYPQGPHAYAQAHDEYVARMAALQKVCSEIYALAEHTL